MCNETLDIRMGPTVRKELAMLAMESGQYFMLAYLRRLSNQSFGCHLPCSQYCVAEI